MNVGEAVEFALPRESFGEKEREAARHGALRASIFRFDTGVEAIRLANARGHVVVLYHSWVRWSGARRSTASNSPCKACFRRRARPRSSSRHTGVSPITPGSCATAFPPPSDTHALHGEAPCADMDETGIACGTDARGPWIAVTGDRDYAMGFGAHYRATPRVVLRLTARSATSSWKSRTSRPRRWISCTCATSISLSRRGRESCSRFPSRRSMS